MQIAATDSSGLYSFETSNAGTDLTRDRGSERSSLWVEWIVDLLASWTEVGKGARLWTLSLYGVILTENAELRLMSFTDRGPLVLKSTKERETLAKLATTIFESSKSELSLSESRPTGTTKVLPALADGAGFLDVLFGGAGSKLED